MGERLSAKLALDTASGGGWTASATRNADELNPPETEIRRSGLQPYRAGGEETWTFR